MATVTITLENPTPAQVATMQALWAETITGKRGRKAKTVEESEPEATVTDEEEETDEIETASLKDEDDEEETDEDEESDDDDEDDKELDFATVKAAINKYGNKNPSSMKTILASFNLKSTKELKAAPKKWEAVYRKVMAKLNK